MEPEMILDPPNKSMQRSFKHANEPVKYNHLLYMDFSDNGGALLGASNINGTAWEGTLFTYKDKESLLNQEYFKYYINNTTLEGKFLTNSWIVIAEDTGCLRILDTSTEGPVSVIASYKHSDRISSVAVWKETNDVVSCAGNNVTVWEIDDIKDRTQVFSNVHTEYINSVDTDRGSGLFATCGADRRALLWDLRNSVPASVLYANEFSSLTSIAWDPSNNDHLIVGSEAGDIYLLDKRQTNNFVEVLHCFKSSVHRLSCNASGQVAICGNTNVVLVVDCKERFLLKTAYRNEDHTGIVRGLAWSENVLYSCGFDKAVIKHVI